MPSGLKQISGCLPNSHSYRLDIHQLSSPLLSPNVARLKIVGFRSKQFIENNRKTFSPEFF